MRERARTALLIVGAVALVAAVVMLWQAGQADSAHRVWEFGQTLAGSFPGGEPMGGTPWRIGAGVSAVIGALAFVGAWIVDE